MEPLDLLVLRCADVDRTRVFYEALGLKFERHRHGSGPEHVGCPSERGVLELYPATDANPTQTAGESRCRPSLVEF